MKSYHYPDNKPGKPPRTVTQNVLLGLAGVGGASFITAMILGLSATELGIILAVVAFFWSLPAYSVLLGIGFLIAGKAKEGAICLLGGSCLLLYGYVACGDFWF